VYAVTVPVDSAKRVVAVTLPDRSRTVSRDVNAAHVFALTTGAPVEYGSLAAAFNNHGPFPGKSLAAAGLRPGTHVRHDGLRFTWPDVAPGRPDNVLALGQVVRVSGMGTRLGFLGASSPSRTMGTGTVHYADGSASDFTFTLDGYADEPGGENQTVAAPRDQSARVRGRSARVLFAAVRIVPGREVRAVTLPPNGVVPGGGPAQGMHIYAMAVG
jgi:beta-galactosidase